MRRYFDVPDQRSTFAIAAEEGSRAALETPENVAKAYKYRGRVREIERIEYIRLTRQYAGHKIPDDWVPADCAPSPAPRDRERGKTDE